MLHRAARALVRARVRAFSSAPPPPPPAPAPALSRASLAALLGAAGAVSGAALLYVRAEAAADAAAAAALPVYEGNPVVFFDIVDGDEPFGRLVFQLRADAVPRSAENVRVLATGALGWGYRNSPLHAVEKGRRVFGGDFFGGGAAGHSIYGPTFADEGFAVRHTGPGVLGLTSTGAHSNNSQFYVTLKRLPELDGRSVAVGTLLEGFDVLAALDAAALNAGGRFGKDRDLRVRACGELKNWRPERPRAPRPAAAARDAPRVGGEARA